MKKSTPNQIKSLVVFGTRPEAIKMAPLIMRLRTNPRLACTVCVTAQHRGMLDQALNDFDIEADIDLNLMRKKQSLSELTGRVVNGVAKQIARISPDVILVHGDTTTAMASALAGFYNGVAIGHVEAGLRSFDLQSPFPEEFNRQLITKVSNFHFAPTSNAVDNLCSEGVRNADIFMTGNTVVDALNYIREKLSKKNIQNLKLSSDLIRILGFDLEKTDFILVTSHRRENIGQGLKNLCDALVSISNARANLRIVFPVHQNPKVKEIVFAKLGKLKNVHLISPLDYLLFVMLMERCRLILTDSGGIQEEALVFNKPVLVLRDNTERPEAIDTGLTKLVGTKPARVISEVMSLLNQQTNSRDTFENPFGDGTAAKKIEQVLISKLGD